MGTPYQLFRFSNNMVNKSREVLFEEAFLVKCGRPKPELMESWLEMNQPALLKECDKLGININGKHIDIIQVLFE